jgi:MbtH protein
MTNPFEDENGVYLVLINEEGQHSLWPEFIDVPTGWVSRFGPESKGNCLAFIEANWTDMRPVSLVKQMQSRSSVSRPPGEAA